MSLPSLLVELWRPHGIGSCGISVVMTWARNIAIRVSTCKLEACEGERNTQLIHSSQLGPVVGPLGRAPAGGRNWEGFSPDPVLSGIANAETVKGIQDAGVIACTCMISA